MTEIINLVNRKRRKSAFCETLTSKKIFRLAEHCHRRGDMGVIVGAPGVGKTTALREYVAENDGALMCPVMPSHTGMASVLGLICQAIAPGLSIPRSVHLRNDVIWNFVKWEPTPVLFVMDESQFLNSKVLDQLRCIHDGTGAGFLFCGNKDFYSRYSNAQKAAFAQFTSRTTAPVNLDSAKPEDSLAIIQSHGIDDAAIVDLLMQISKRPGALRLLAKTIEIAGEMAPSGKDITMRDIEDAAALTGGLQ